MELFVDSETFRRDLHSRDYVDIRMKRLTRKVPHLRAAKTRRDLSFLSLPMPGSRRRTSGFLIAIVRRSRATFGGSTGIKARGDPTPCLEHQIMVYKHEYDIKDQLWEVFTDCTRPFDAVVGTMLSL